LFNNSRPPFNNKVLRQAFAEAIDLDAYNKSLDGGVGTPARTLFNQSSQFFENIPLSHYDPADATSKFKSAFDANGGKKIDITLTTTQGRSTDVATFFQGQLLQDGSGDCKACQFKQYVNISIQIVTTTALISNATNGSYDVQVWGYNVIDPDPILFNGFSSGSSLNYARYSNSQMDAALAQGRTTIDPAVRRQAYKTVQQIWADEVPVFFYARSQSGVVFDSKVQDVRLIEDGTPLFDRLWIDRG
jgi:peptide/nickel transport system substrate-binding protein